MREAELVEEISFVHVHSYLIESNPHCVISRWSVCLVTIGSGSENMTALETHAVARIVKHPKYNGSILDYDAQMAKLQTPVVESNVRKPIALVAAGEDGAAGEPVVVSGWGVTKVSALLKNVDITLT